MITIPLPWTSPPLTLNQRPHWATRNRKAQEIADAVQLLARKLPKPTPPVQVVMVWSVTDRRVRDADNPSLTTKACVDGMVRAGLIPADHWQVVPVSYCRIQLGTERRMWLEVTEWADDASKSPLAAPLSHEQGQTTPTETPTHQTTGDAA